MIKNDNNILIDYMNIGQLNDVLEIERLCFTDPWSLNAFVSDLSDNKKALYFSASTGGRVIGYIGMWVIFDEAHIMNVAVHPEFRKMGIGSALIQKIIDTSKLRNLSSMTLEVRKGNLTAIELYKRFGFAESGIRKGYYEDTNEDAVIMWKTL